MTSDLKQLLTDSVADAPAEAHSVSDIVRSAQRTHRRHTAKLVGGSALALALVAGVGYAALSGNGSDDAEPVRKLEHGPVKTIDKGDLKDARQLVAGEDYDVLAELPVAETQLSSLAGGWSPDDLMVVKKDEEFVAVSGQDGSETVLSGHRADGHWPIGAGEGYVAWFHSSDRRSPDRLTVEDVSSGQSHALVLHLDGVESDSIIPVLSASIEAGRVWTMLPVGDDGTRFVSVSAPLDGSSGLRQEIEGTVSQAVTADGKLVWTEGFGEPLMVRDLESGEEAQIAPAPLARDFPPMSLGMAEEPQPIDPGRKCRFAITSVSAERVVTTPECESGDAGYSTSGDGTVWSLVGGPIIKLPGSTTLAGGLSDDRVLFQDFTGKGRDLTTYAYEFETGEVVNLGTVRAHKFASEVEYPARVSGDRLTIPSRNHKGYLALIALRP